jgi:thiol:disulfide interchange protein DsbD
MVEMLKKRKNLAESKICNAPKSVCRNPATLKFHFIFFLLLILNPIHSFAEEEFINLNNMPPPQVTIFPPGESVTSGTHIHVEVIIPEQWQVNANIAADEFLKPSSLEMTAQGIHFAEPLYPEPVKEYNEALDLENLIFKDTILIQVPVETLENSYDISTLSATFHYQACSNSICLAPASVSVSLTGLAPQTAPPVSKKKSESFLILLAFAFLGGILLNLMPCVLPVLSLKLFGFIREAGESRKRLAVLGLSVTAGIVCSLWALAFIITLARAGGGSAGWGLQFQSPGFIAFMVALLSLFAASLFGAFDVWLPGSALTKMDAASKKQGFAGAFFTGALLVLLSTPCSAPFLGAAMGFAFTASTPVLFLFFTAAALGLSLPYLIICAFPKTLALLPKPGAWMPKFKKILGLLMLGTVIWLIWTAYRVAGAAGIAFLTVLSLVSLGGGVFLGKFAPPTKPFSREIISALVLILLLFGIWQWIAVPFVDQAIAEKQAALENEAQDQDGWLRYSPELMRQLARENKTVFLNITADWCLTCKANEALVLNRDTILQALTAPGVAKVKADWTRKDSLVQNLMESLKRSGVPVYAVYKNGKNEPEILSEILTVNAILEALKE